VFSVSDFHETPQGACRILAPLTHQLALTSPTWAQRLAPLTEHVATQLADSSPASIRTPTSLTQTRRKTAAAAQRRSTRTPRTRPPQPVSHCQDCGIEVQPPQRRCPDCSLTHRTSPNHPRLTRLADLRAQGHDPAHGGDPARRRGRTNAHHVAANIAWEQVNPRPDAEEFRRDILPRLQHCTPQQIADATGLTRPYSALIRKGAYTPHPRHWQTLRTLAGVPQKA
jgi:hypothetical protein